jgi:hypothetical protein
MQEQLGDLNELLSRQGEESSRPAIAVPPQGFITTPIVGQVVNMASMASIDDFDYEEADMPAEFDYFTEDEEE